MQAVVSANGYVGKGFILDRERAFKLNQHASSDPVYLDCSSTCRDQSYVLGSKLGVCSHVGNDL